jgi:hypothetical protein
MKKIQLREQVFPVVALDLCARLPPEQNELQGARIGNVRRYVHEVLASPPRAYCRREPVPLAQECAREDERDRELKEASSEDPDKAAEDPENHVAGLMEDQVGQVQNGIRDANCQVQMTSPRTRAPRAHRVALLARGSSTSSTRGARGSATAG